VTFINPISPLLVEASGLTLREDVLRLLREDAEFREEMALLLMRTPMLEEIRGLREDFNKRFEAHERRFAEFEGRMEELRDDFNKRMEELRQDFNKTFNAFTQELSGLRRTLNAIGYRWGFVAEGAFREGMRGLLEKYGLEVRRLEFEDKWGIVHRRVQPVEVDVCIKDEVHTLVEVAASASRGDIELLYRKGELYEKVYGAKPKLVLVSLHPSDEALNLAKAYNITIYTS